jgi:two-component system, cell cycle sensor histidine kinase and response regulator CckA
MDTGRTVLVVDDEEIDRTSAADILRAHGYTVLEAESYRDAMSVFDMHREEIQLLVADVVLPDGNGCALAVSMRKHKSDLRVLFMSFHVGAEALRYHGVSVTDIYFLQKPLDESRLMRHVERVLSAEEPFPELRLPQSLTSTNDRG